MSPRKRSTKFWPVRKSMCSSCPFREGGDRELAARVLKRTLFKASQICHHPALEGGKEHELCRGARNEQLNILYHMKILPAPTDAAFTAMSIELGVIKPEGTNET
jgi:hypothetical protein